MASIVLSSCSEGAKTEIEYIPPEVERYENPIEIEGQWGASAATGPDGQYGIGDPFVMKMLIDLKTIGQLSKGSYCKIGVFVSNDKNRWYRLGSLRKGHSSITGSSISRRWGILTRYPALE